MLPALLAIIFGVGGITFLIALSSMIRGFVLVKLWAWFVVPLFGFPALTMAPAIGLSLVVGYLTFQHFHTEDDRSWSTKFSESIGLAVVYPFLVLLIGWIITLFM